MTNVSCFIVVWRTEAGKVWQSERYATTAQAARDSFKRDRKNLARKARILYTKEHGGTRYANRGQFV